MIPRIAAKIVIIAMVFWAPCNGNAEDGLKMTRQEKTEGSGNDRILETFRKWTEGKSPEAARIAVFERVRDIPYAIVPELRDPEIGAEKILELNKGGCQPKHYLLGRLFNELGIPVKYVTYVFRWDDPSIRYPPDLAETAKELPEAYHLALKAKIGGRWVLVDATWDLPLEKAGFPVNRVWDGSSDTRNAVIPIGEIEHETSGGRYDYEMSRRNLLSGKDKERYSGFIRKFNQWIETERNQK